MSTRAEHYVKAEVNMATANSGEVPLNQVTPLLLQGLLHATLATADRDVEYDAQKLAKAQKLVKQG